jgi:hypothetical protein
VMACMLIWREANWGTRQHTTGKRPASYGQSRRKNGQSRRKYTNSDGLDWKPSEESRRKIHVGVNGYFRRQPSEIITSDGSRCKLSEVIESGTHNPSDSCLDGVSLISDGSTLAVGNSRLTSDGSLLAVGSSWLWAGPVGPFTSDGSLLAVGSCPHVTRNPPPSLTAVSFQPTLLQNKVQYSNNKIKSHSTNKVKKSNHNLESQSIIHLKLNKI